MRTDASASPRVMRAIHPMMNAIGGTSIHYWAQSWRLKPWDFKTRSEAIRRYGASAIPKGRRSKTGRSATTIWSRITTSSSTRSAFRARPGNIQGKLDPLGNVFEAPRQREYPMPPLRGSEIHRSHGGGGETARAGSRFVRRRRSIRRNIEDGPGCALSRLLRSAADATSARRIRPPSPRFPRRMKTKNLTIFDRAQVTRIVAGAERPRHRRDLHHAIGKEYFQPAKVVLVGVLHLRKLAAAAAVEIEGVSQRACRTITARWGGIISGIGRQRRDARCFRSTSMSGTECPRRARRWTIGPTITSITRTGLHRRDEPARRTPRCIRSRRRR